MGSDAASAVTAVWRLESARLVAALTRMTNDVGLAEDLAQDALVAALEQWPSDLVPSRPRAWLDGGRERRAVDHIEDDVPAAGLPHLPPGVVPEARAALTLWLVGGLSTQDIARAFLVKDATIGQRISRAKEALVGVDFELPSGQPRRERLADVMSVVYLIFNEGYSATMGEDWMRPELCLEALRLARTLAHLVPDEPEVHGLQALLEIQGPHPRADPVGWRARAAGGPGPAPVGPAAAAARVRSAAAGRGSRQAGRPLRPAGSHRGLPRSGPALRAFGPEVGLLVLDRVDEGALGGIPPGADRAGRPFRPSRRARVEIVGSRSTYR